MQTKFERSVLPARGCMTHGTDSTSSKLVNVPAPQCGLKNGDREVLQWYVSRVAPHLQFAQVAESAEFAFSQDIDMVQVTCLACIALVLDQ